MRWDSRAGKLVREISLVENTISWLLMKRNVVSQLQSWLLHGKIQFHHSDNSNYPFKINILVCTLGEQLRCYVRCCKVPYLALLPVLGRHLKLTSVSKVVLGAHAWESQITALLSIMWQYHCLFLDLYFFGFKVSVSPECIISYGTENISVF